MKRQTLKFIILLISALLITSCKPEAPQTILHVSIVDQTITRTLPAVIRTMFVGTVKGPLKPVELNIEWIYQDSIHENTTLIAGSKTTFTEMTPIKSIVFISLDGLPSGYYWLRLTWIDDNGVNILLSNKIYYTLTK